MSSRSVKSLSSKFPGLVFTKNTVLRLQTNNQICLMLKMCRRNWMNFYLTGISVHNDVFNRRSWLYLMKINCSPRCWHFLLVDIDTLMDNFIDIFMETLMGFIMDNFMNAFIDTLVATLMYILTDTYGHFFTLLSTLWPLVTPRVLQSARGKRTP